MEENRMATDTASSARGNSMADTRVDKHPVGKRDHRVIVTWSYCEFRTLHSKMRDAIPNLTKSEAEEIAKIYKDLKWVESVDIERGP